MKKNILYIILLILGLNLGACSLEEDPKYEYDSKFVFDSEDTANATIMEAYNYLATIYGNHLHYITVANGTMVTRTQPGEYSRAAAYDMDALGGNLSVSYQLLYKMIDLSNRIMEGFETSNLSEDSKREGSGHAYFLRGYAYYLLGSLWGRASIHTKPISDESTFFKPLSSRADVYAQAEADLLVASEKLLSDESAIGFANKNVVNAYLAKLYFMLASQKQAGLESSHYDTAEELWRKTIEYGDKVDNKTYLDPDYASMFGTEVSTSEEIIFQLNYTLSTDKGVRKDWNRVFAPYWYGVNSEKTQSYRTIVMDRAFYDYQAGTHPGDLRMKTIFLTDFLKGARYDETNRRIASYPFVLYKKIKTEKDKTTGKKIKILEKEVLIDGRNFMKPGSNPKNPEYDFSDVENLPKDNKRENHKEEVYKVWSSMGYGAFTDNLYSFSGKGVDKNSDANYDTNNVILYRNADLLLLLADAYNELGDERTSNEYINLVLTRAGLGNAPSMSKEDRRKFIFFERMFELAGEPILWEDVRRRGTEYLKKIIEIHNNSWFVKYRVKAEKDAIESGKTKVPDAFRAIIINNYVIDDNFLKKNLLMPIPYSEIIRNENISQSDQNFGYN